MKVTIKSKIRENFVKATPKEKACRVTYLLLMLLLCPIAIPSMFIAYVCDEVIDKLNDLLW